MAQPSIDCPYCSANIPLTTVRQTRRWKWGVQIFESEESSSMETISYGVKCPLCDREYTAIKTSDYLWVKNKLKPTDTMLETFKIMFPEADLDSIYDNIVGVTRPPRQLFRRNRLHICFEINGMRAYIDCHRRNNTLSGLDVCEV